MKVEQASPAQPPGWLIQGAQVTKPMTYTPLALDRQGERMAWSVTVGLLALLIFFRWRTQSWIAALLVLFVLFILASILISFGAWMERNTQIEITSDALRYKNPLRDRSVPWDAVARIYVYPRGGGWRVLVQSSIANFGFQTSTIMNPGWGRAIETGVPGGEMLVSQIVGMSNLTNVAAEGDGWVCNRDDEMQA